MVAGYGDATRRTFLTRSVAIAGTTPCAPALATAARKKIKIGYAGSLWGVEPNFGATDADIVPLSL
ncbi:hypothetical protein J4E08_20315 [Sagittula sp. NFXS13]|uniref:hypothetical protein n=1 Tax=Sagittula sp. NFXS13 TaxID=2819095 RepID=UPI0032DEF06F